MASEVAPPSGTVTFLFTDVEGSTVLWSEDQEAMSNSLSVHDALVDGAIGDHGGYVFTTAGDAFCAAFGSVSSAVRCAEAIQVRLGAAEWSGPSLRVRIGLHLGEAEERAGDYFGPVVNCAARIESAGHGGQILLSEAVRVAADIDARNLGSYRLAGVGEPVGIYQLGVGEYPPLRATSPAAVNLPSVPTRLIGRTEEVRSIRLALLDGYLVTVTGVGGTGKTRLAIEVAHQMLPDLVDGAYFADLSVVTDPDAVGSAVAAAFRLQADDDPVERVVEFLSERDALLVLDNCEHVVDACADLAGAVLAAGPVGRILATSRELLDVDGEQVFQAPSLDAADGSSPAVELFVQRALASAPSLEVTQEVRAVAAELCRRLDGVPLAIELAAARCGVLGPSGLLERIDDRFALLAGGRRRSRQRRRTLEATLDWSYDLLDEQEQSFFRQLGAFVGLFDLTAACAVGGVSEPEAIDLLEALVDKSMVVGRPGPSGSQFRLLETMRAYAEDRLVQTGELETTRDQHLEHLVSRWGRFDFDTAAEDPEIKRMLAPNIEAAMEWAVTLDRWVECAQLYDNISTVWHDLGQFHQIIQWFERIAQGPDGYTHCRLGPVVAAWSMMHVGRASEGFALLSAAQSSNREIARLAELHASLFLSTSDPDQTINTTTRILSDATGVAAVAAHTGRGMAHLTLGEFEAAAADLERALQLTANGLHPSSYSVMARLCLASIEMTWANPQRALELLAANDLDLPLWSTDIWEAVALARLGRRAEAVEQLELGAQGAIFGRVPARAIDTVIAVAAVLAYDGNDSRARRYLLAFRPIIPPSIQMARLLASELDCSADLEAVLQQSRIIDSSPAIELLRDGLEDLNIGLISGS